MRLNLFCVCWSGTGGVGPDCVRECCVLTGGEPPARPSVNINTHCGRLITSPWRENIAGTWNQFYPLENAHSDWQWPHCALTGTEYNKLRLRSVSTRHSGISGWPAIATSARRSLLGLTVLTRPLVM